MPAVETSDAHAKTAAERDERPIGFLLCLWVLSLTAVLGLELRVLLEHGLARIALLLLLLFVAVNVLTTYVLIHRSVAAGWIKLNGRRVRISTADAPEAVARIVVDRAKELGLEATLHVYYMPRTWNVVDAYVSGLGEHQSLVMTGGLLKYAYSSRPEERAQFEFVIDHELGHVNQADTTVLYAARATLLTALMFVPVKIAFFAWKFDILTRNYAELFPRGFEWTPWLGREDLTTGIGWTPSATTVTIAIAIFTSTATLALWSVYVMLVRRRELVADQFALNHAKDWHAARAALSQLLGTAGLSSAPPQSFHGNIRWHPKAAERLSAVGSAVISSLGEGVVAALLAALLLTFRFAFGASTEARLSDDVPSAVFEPIAGIFVLLFGWVFQSIVARRRGHGPFDDAVSKPALVGWSAVIAIVLMAIVFFRQPVEAPWAQSQSSLLQVERLEWMLLLLSMPVVVAFFSIGDALTDRLFPQGSGSVESRLGRSVVGSLVALALLWLTSLVVEPPLNAYRQKMLGQHRHQVEERLTSEAASVKELSELSPEEGSARRLTEALSFRPAREGEELEKHLWLEREGLKITETRMARHEFRPPLAFMLLWQGPMRGTFF